MDSYDPYDLDAASTQAANFLGSIPSSPSFSNRRPEITIPITPLDVCSYLTSSPPNKHPHKSRFYPFALNASLLLLLVFETHSTLRPSTTSYKTLLLLPSFVSVALHIVQIILFTIAGVWNFLLLEEYCTGTPRKKLWPLDDCIYSCVYKSDLSWIRYTKGSRDRGWLVAGLVVFVIGMVLVPWVLVITHLVVRPPVVTSPTPMPTPGAPMTATEVCLSGGYNTLATLYTSTISGIGGGKGKMVLTGLGSNGSDNTGNDNRNERNKMRKEEEELIFFTSIRSPEAGGHDDDLFSPELPEEFVVEYSDEFGTARGVKFAEAVFALPPSLRGSFRSLPYSFYVQPNSALEPFEARGTITDNGRRFESLGPPLTRTGKDGQRFLDDAEPRRNVIYRIKNRRGVGERYGERYGDGNVNGMGKEEWCVLWKLEEIATKPKLLETVVVPLGWVMGETSGGR